jgi:hypothetical protein
VIGKTFRQPAFFLRAAKRKIEATFHNFFDVVNLYEIFYVMKVVGKIHWGVFVIGRIVNFHFRPILEFFDSRFWSGLKNLDFFRNFANFSLKSKVEISKNSPNYS